MCTVTTQQEENALTDVTHQEMWVTQSLFAMCIHILCRQECYEVVGVLLGVLSPSQYLFLVV